MPPSSTSQAQAGVHPTVERPTIDPAIGRLLRDRGRRISDAELVPILKEYLRLRRVRRATTSLDEDYDARSGQRQILIALARDVLGPNAIVGIKKSRGRPRKSINEIIADGELLAEFEILQELFTEDDDDHDDPDQDDRGQSLRTRSGETNDAYETRVANLIEGVWKKSPLSIGDVTAGPSPQPSDDRPLTLEDLDNGPLTIVSAPPLPRDRILGWVRTAHQRARESGHGVRSLIIWHMLGYHYNLSVEQVRGRLNAAKQDEAEVNRRLEQDSTM